MPPAPPSPRRSSLRGRALAGTLAIGALAVVAALVVFVFPPGVQSTAAVAGDSVAVTCRAAGVTEPDCGTWGQRVLDDGPPSSTFEMEDLARVELQRPLFGSEGGPGCQAAYFLSRYPEDAVWTKDISCFGG